MEKISKLAEEIASRIISDLGLDPNAIDTYRGRTVGESTAIGVERSNERWTRHLGQDSLSARFWEVGSWRHPLPSLPDMLSARTGRQYHIGQLVWVHNRFDSRHEITCKAALLAFTEQDNIARIEDQYFIFSCSQIYFTIDGAGFDGTKLWCLEPIQEKDRAKTAREMQDEWDEADDRCQKIEKAGATTLRQVARTFSKVELRVQLIGASAEFLRQVHELGTSIVSQVSKDEGVETVELKPWVVLSPTAKELYEQYRSFTELPKK